ncbi:hypothetical protein FC40_GL000252 [Ligilactobacillus hayakitensis DSM 18933 = JCM 14209]|uniref:ATPase AAA-type core domain-containing protein n=2 Tax=Ligilactobacillus TaxID=2767887 RepID=A0A0R1WPH8_9LACO|nr:hypothetical protein FC40_GL000252 [Ligilactobacillus hayakitensis DSM 18933 = JCM 14209]
MAMLRSVTVSGFKNFSNKMTFDLTAGNYSFNDEGITENGRLVKNAIVYGKNGSGKSNLGLAIMDIITHLTDKQVNYDDYSNKYYVNLESDFTAAEFRYEFEFESGNLVYVCKKKNYDDVIFEEILINKRIVLQYDREKNYKFVDLKGTESLNLNYDNPSLSLTKYVFANTGLDPEYSENKVFLDFKKFVNSMLSFTFVESSHYQGFTNGSDSMIKIIIERNKVQEFQDFLKTVGINYDLFVKEVDGEKKIYARFPSGREVDIFSIMSKGTKSLVLFYNWYLHFEDEVRFVFIDEFDANYHNDTSRKIVELLKKLKNTQSILTTHNTYNMSTEILRPDCLFVVQDNQVNSIQNETDRELRKAHNLEKMYRAGAFDDK